MVDRSQYEPGKTAIAAVGPYAPVVVIDESETDILIQIAAHFLGRGVRESLADHALDIRLEEPLECHPALLGLGLYQPQNALGDEIASDERGEGLNRAAARVTRKPCEAIGA